MRQPRTPLPGAGPSLAAMFFAILAVTPAAVHGQSVTAMWDPRPISELVTSYQVCIGTSSQSCNIQLASTGGNETAYTFSPAGGVLHYVAVRASNSLGAGPYSAEVTFSIPSLAQPANQSGPVGATITPLTLSVTDPDGSPRTFTHTGLPTGLTLNPTTGQITGAPAAVGTYNVTVFVNDGLVTVSRSFTWTVTDVASVVSVSPSSGSGSSQTFTLVYASVLGANDLGSVRVRFGVSASIGANNCTVAYTPGTGQASILNDAGTAWSASSIGSGVLSNSQCSVNLAGSSASLSGNNLTLTLAVTFTSSFAGTKNSYMFAQSNNGTNTGWQSRGSWTVPSPGVATVSAVSVSPASGSGTTQTFTLQYSDSLGAADLASARVRFATTSSVGVATCTLSYNLGSNALSILNDAATSWQAATLGSGTLANGQCSVNLAASSATPSGNNLTLALAVTFSSSFAGAKNTYMLAESAGGANSGWQQRGSWTVPGGTPVATVSAVSVSPNAGSGSSQTFTLQYSDSLGALDLASARVRFATAATIGAGTCTLSYNPSGNSLSILDDGATGWQAGTLGSGTLSNSQCSVNLASSSASISGNNLTLALAVTFSASFAGAKNTYMFAESTTGPNSGWVQRGSWTVPGSGIVGVPQAVSVTPGSGSGSSGTFVLQYSDSAGALDLATARVRFGPTSSSGTNNCTVSYEPGANTVSMLNDAGTAWQVASFGSGTLANSQCSVNLASSSASVNGNDLTVTLAVTFNPSFTGIQTIYMLATTVGGANTGWLQRGTWTPYPSSGPASISVIQVTPYTGTGTVQTFVLDYSDSLGAMDLASARVRFASSNNSGVNSCTISYDPVTQQVSLLNNAGTAWASAGFGIGTLQNSQCTVQLGSSSASANGNNLTVTLTVSFSSTFRGARGIYMLADNNSGVSTGWRGRGLWNVP